MANLNRQAIDVQRKINNQSPLSDAEWNELQLQHMSEEEKAEHLKKNPPAPAANPEGPTNNPEEKPVPEVQVREMTDEELLALVAKRTGRAALSTWDELHPTPEQSTQQQAEEERHESMVTWGLQNKRFKSKEYENYISDSKDPVSLVYNYRLQEAKKEDPELDETAFKEEFDEEFGLDKKPDTRRFKNGQSTLKKIAQGILHGTYKNIVSLESDYSAHEKEQTARTKNQEKVKAAAPVYKADVEKAFSRLKKITAQFNQDEAYDLEVKEELEASMNEIKETMLSPDFASREILRGYTPEQLQETMFNTFLIKKWPALTHEVAKQYLLKHAAGTKGIPRLTPTSGEVDESNLTESQKVLKQMIADNKPAPAAAN